MADETNAQERTEQATPQRRRQARQKGQVAKSQELNSVLMLAAGTLLLVASMPYLLKSAGALMSVSLQILGDGPALENRMNAMFFDALEQYFRLLAPAFVVTVVIAITSNVSQVGFHFTPAAIAPKLGKLNPIEGFKRILGKRALVELAKGLFKVFVVSAIAYLTLRDHLGKIAGFVFFVPGAMAPEAARIGASFAVKALVVLGFMATVDYAYQRWEFEKQIRMSRQDLKEELKENEGDPLLKSRVRAIQQKIATQRMMEGVKGAALVVTNPTRYAVALGYDDEDSAPRVVAKGMNLIAARIKEIAREHNVPIVEKPTLARMLYRECEIGQYIPAFLYEAVAEILAYVYSLKKKLRS